MEFFKRSKKLYSAEGNQNGYPTCVFCDSQDTGLTIAGLDICNYHLAIITDTPLEEPPVSDMRPHKLFFGNLHLVPVDEIGRVLIPARFYNQLGMQKGSRLTASVDITNKFVELFVRPDGNMHIDDHNRVLLSPKIIGELGWGNGDKIGVTLDVPHNLIRLTLEEKYVSKCVFCSSSNIAMKLQGRDICKYHLEEIKKSS